MSGIAGILKVDGAPVDRELLSTMTKYLAFRGPDAQQIKCVGPIGLGHSLLRTGRELASGPQPASLDGNAWIIADARIDARSELLGKLRSEGRNVPAGSGDAELILHAYQVWGSACVDHLLGDFAFAIWDGPAQKLFCVRDHFGVKCFYYARVGNSLVFSNTLDCLRLHPDVSDRLNDLAIADFLLFESSQDPGTTTFCDIARLEPAHTLEVKDGQISVRRYWTLPVSAPFENKHPMECVEQFGALMDAAVADRVRSGPAGVLMSGGLDSSTVAARAHGILSRAGLPAGLRAYTQIFDGLIPHDERVYAGLVAEALRIPIQFQVADEYKLFEGAGAAENKWPEPAHMAWAAPQFDQLRQLAEQSGVALTGFGGDPTLCCLLSVHFGQLLKQGELGRAMAEAFRYVTMENRVSRLYLRSRWLRWFSRAGSEAQFPNWVNPEFEDRYQLRKRWKCITERVVSGEGVRPVAYRSMISPMWPRIFELMDAGVTGCAVEVCHPFFDLRLVGYLLSLPALPWCSDKELLREAARGVLPDEVRLRPKTALAMDPVLALLQKPDSAWVDRFDPVPGLERYVVRDRIPAVFKERDSWAACINLRPLSLNYWLQRAPPIRQTGGDYFRGGVLDMLDHEASAKIRKPYQQPALRVYGNVECITATSLALPNVDAKGSGHSSNKTS